MMQTARGWRVLVGGLGVLAAGVAGVVGFAGVTASAEPVFPSPNPVPVTQPVTVAPAAVGAASPSVAPSATPSAAVGPPVVPASSGTLRDYLNGNGVKLQPQKPQGFDALDVTVPVPTGWTQVPDPNVPDAFVVIANRSGDSLYTSNAQVVVYKLVGNFDPKEAITHGYVDSQQLMAWQTTSASLADFGGFPSSIIEGTYRENDMTLNTSRRHVIATSGPDKYLVSLAVTTAVAQTVAEAPATDAIVNGFGVTTATTGAPPASAPASAPAPAAPPGLPGLPQVPALPQLPGLMSPAPPS